MKAIIKTMWANSPTIDLDSYHPENLENFSLWIEFKIGPEGLTGADDYRLLVCTPEWLRQNVSEPRWGRHMLIVREYDRSVIEKCVCDYVMSCTGDKWEVIEGKVARNLSWEFEDYQS
jgi:hypothetical protein